MAPIAWGNVFERLADDGEIHRDLLPQALELGGLYILEQEDPLELGGLIEQALRASSIVYTTLSLGEFKKFVGWYRQRLAEIDISTFQKFDRDESGTIEVEELISVLKELNFHPLQHVVDEVIEEFDTSRGESHLTQASFLKLLEVLRAREGFSKFEFGRLMEAFRLYDTDRSGRLGNDEFVRLLGFLYYSVQPKEALAIVKNAGVGHSGELCKREFLRCMRKVRELELNAIRESLRRVRHSIQVAPHTSSGIDVRCMLQGLMAMSSYCVDGRALKEAAQDAGISLPALDVSLSDAWRFLEIFRAREGFTRSEAAEIDEVFAKFSAAADTAENPETIAQMDVAEADIALRWLGWSPKHEPLQLLLSEVDIYDKGRIDQNEFKKLVRKFREFQLGELRNDLTESDSFECSLYHKNVNRYLEVSKSIQGSRGLVQSFRQNEGFSPEEVKQQKKTFDKYDSSGDGDLTRAELRKLCEDFVPEMATRVEARKELLQLFKDAEDDGRLDFREFLKLSRMIEKNKQLRRLHETKKAVKEAGLSSSEVRGFREIFISRCSGDPQCLRFQDVHAMLLGVTPIGDKSVIMLRDIWSPLATTDDHESDRRMLFPSFLVLMRRLLDANFANLKTVVESSDFSLARQSSS
jgi:Ca2+-binding EF-hand superfamily protein